MHNAHVSIIYTKMSTTSEVLARAMPKLLQAVLGGAGSVEGSRAPRLGGITKEIGDHLIAEVCSIFLLNDSGRDLRLVEAHGYRQVAIDTPHDLSSGLTGRIYSKKVELLLNYTVQDPARGWAGKLDPQLETYCWSLLGVPIVSPSSTQCLGVLKFENKRKGWCNIEDGKYLRSLIPLRGSLELGGGEKQICTPKDIALQLDALISAASNQIDTPSRDRIAYLRKRLVEATDGISFEIEPLLPRDLSALDPNELSGTMDSVSWAVNGLQQEVGHLQTHHPAMVHLHTLMRALSLALDAYNPFSLEDLYLARAVAAMIGAAIDARELMLKGRQAVRAEAQAVRAEALAMLRHGLKSVSGDFLSSVAEILRIVETKGFLKQTEPFSQVLYESAIEISGSCGVVATSASEMREIRPVSFATFYSMFLLSKLGFYSQLASVTNKRMVFPKTKDSLSEDIQTAQVPYAYGLVGGVLDCVVLNAVQHGGQRIELIVSRKDSSIVLEIYDDGPRIISDHQLADINTVPSEIIFSQRGGFGLKACMKAMGDVGFAMEVVQQQGTRVRLFLPIIDLC